MTRLLLRLLVTAGAVLLAQWISAQWFGRDFVRVDGSGAATLLSAFLFAVVLGLMNALVRPILLLLTCPINFVTLGLFVFVVNAVVFWLATWFPVGVEVTGFVGALIGSLTVSICSAIANYFIR